MPADSPVPNSPTVDLTTAFKDVAGDFIDSARKRTELELFLSIAIAAWNVSVRGPAEADDMISTFIESFECKTFQVRRNTVDVRRKVLDLADRKTRLYPDLMVIIRESQCQDRREGPDLQRKLAEEMQDPTGHVRRHADHILGFGSTILPLASFPPAVDATPSSHQPASTAQSR